MNIIEPSIKESYRVFMITNFTKGFMFLLCLFITGQAFSQLDPFLLLEKPGTKHRIRYYAGDEIIFKMKDVPDFNYGVIQTFSDTSIFFNEDTEVKLKDIEAVADRSKVKSVRKIANGAFLVIPGFFLFSIANNAFNTGNRPLVDQEIYAMAAVFATIGGLGYLYKGKRYRLKGRWRLIVVHH